MLSAIYLALLLLLILLLILILLILFAAIDIFIEVEKEGTRMQHLIRVKWLFISHVLKDDTSSKELSSTEASEKSVSEKESRVDPGSESEFESSSRKRYSDLRSVIREGIAALKMLIKPVLKLLEGLVSVVHIHQLKCKLRFGFDDPAHTGIAYGYSHALKGYLFHKCRKAELDVEPVFIDEVMDILAIAHFRLRIASLIPVILGFILNRNVLRVSWAYIRNRSRNKKIRARTVNI
ncbi:DUF2953 domain-containing protein [Methanolobus sp. ZRKC3]|uniref:DUF2953 domain-containing protein n=1 Tax=Methanolobus sp. ZRKC3 TaxID=3125786 RepID=UPI0032567E96